MNNQTTCICKKSFSLKNQLLSVGFLSLGLGNENIREKSRMFTTISAFEFWGRGTGQLSKLLKFDHQRAFISFREKTHREREGER